MEEWRRDRKRTVRGVIRGRRGRLGGRRRRRESRRGARGRFMIILLSKKGTTAARLLTGWAGGVAWAVLPAAEMLVGDTVAGTTYVGRHVAVLLATKEVGSGWFTGGAPALRCYSFVIFSRGVQTRESVRDRFPGDGRGSKSILCCSILWPSTYA